MNLLNDPNDPNDPNDSVDFFLDSYDYELPQELIANRPKKIRSLARLLVYDQQTDKIFHDFFCHLPRYLPKNSLLIFNNSKVIPSRLWALKKTGGKGEIFILQQGKKENEALCFLKFSGKRKEGESFLLQGNFSQEVTATLLTRDSSDNASFILKFSCPLEFILEKAGQIPLPPYIRKGIADNRDHKDYQTVFAKQAGSVAAPTAGLHFDYPLLWFLKNEGHLTKEICLHVGVGTFKPIESPNILDHTMHSENFSVPLETVRALNSYEKKRCVAVGTTSLRVLETLFEKTEAKTNLREEEIISSTNIFLTPASCVKSVGGLITNFHLPKSSLLVLVSSLIGRKKALEIYQQAMASGYYFYSYGDGMLIKLSE